MIVIKMVAALSMVSNKWDKVWKFNGLTTNKILIYIDTVPCDQSD